MERELRLVRNAIAPTSTPQSQRDRSPKTTAKRERSLTHTNPLKPNAIAPNRITDKTGKGDRPPVIEPIDSSKNLCSLHRRTFRQTIVHQILTVE